MTQIQRRCCVARQQVAELLARDDVQAQPLTVLRHAHVVSLLQRDPDLDLDLDPNTEDRMAFCWAVLDRVLTSSSDNFFCAPSCVRHAAAGPTENVADADADGGEEQVVVKVGLSRDLRAANFCLDLFQDTAARVAGDQDGLRLGAAKYLGARASLVKIGRASCRERV